jgi:asparagine synthase (glutamine-hydrolysing)
MCGIVGIVNLNHEPVLESSIRDAADSMIHRGPDDSGVMVWNHVALGHQRLSIIDLSPAGHQPMSNEDGRIWIVYNGEAYNYRELRAQLKREGHVFKSNTDAEVFIHLYESYGLRCVEFLNGMFAFAIYDQDKKRLFLARDRYGIKPLYYWHGSSVFVFASEIKAILTHPDVHANLCYEALSEYFTFQNIFSDLTLFEGIRMLPNGCWLMINELDSGPPNVRVERYWDYHFSSDYSLGSEEEVAEELYNRFETAVVRQLVSGGMDSGSITAIAACHIPRLNTFTCGFDLSSATGFELGFDERSPSELMASTFKTTHYETVLNSLSMQWVMPRMVWHLEDLRLGMCYPNYYIAELASKFVKVVLSGGGGDELFGGYPWRYYRALAHGLDQDQYLRNYHERAELFNPDTWRYVKDHQPYDAFRAVLSGLDIVPTRPEGYVDWSLCFEAKTFLHGLFVLEDKLNMAHSLEMRVPFMDNDLVDFAMRIPASYKLRNLAQHVRIDENEFAKKRRYFLKTLDGKTVLRCAMARLLPEGIIERQKQGFSAPDESWYRGESVEYVRSVLLDPEAHLYEYLNREYVERILDEHINGLVNHRLLIWSFLSFEWWLDVFLAGQTRMTRMSVEQAIPLSQLNAQVR